MTENHVDFTVSPQVAPPEKHLTGGAARGKIREYSETGGLTGMTGAGYAFASKQVSK